MAENLTSTPTPGIKRIHPPRAEGDRGFDLQFSVGDGKNGGAITFVCEDVPQSEKTDAQDAAQVLEAAEMRILAVKDAAANLRRSAAELVNAAQRLGLGGAALRQLLLAEGVRMEGRCVSCEVPK